MTWQRSGSGQAKVIALADERLDFLHRRARVRHQVFRPAVLLVDRVDDFGDGLAPAFGIVRRQSCLRKITGQSWRATTYMSLANVGEFRLGVRQHLIGAHAGIEHQFHLAFEFLLAQAAIRRWRGTSNRLREISGNPSTARRRRRRRI